MTGQLTLAKPIRQFYKLVLNPFDNRRLAELCGQFDDHLRQVERYLGVEISNRGNVFQIIGNDRPVSKAAEILNQLFDDTGNAVEITPQKIQLMLQTATAEEIDKKFQLNFNDMMIQTKQSSIRPRSVNQYSYLENILHRDINFGIGPSGTGKTYLAVACAVSSLEKEQVRRIVLVRPAVEAGEKLGFLPGNLAEKVDPYLRPLYDALFEMMGVEKVHKFTETGTIEVAPLAYMRGRTLNDSFVILDESQNTTREQMKMFLTRIGFGSKVVITGDITQTDLPKNTESGLRHAIEVLKEIEDINFTFFQAHDVVRHPLVQKIVQAYDKYEKD